MGVEVEVGDDSVFVPGVRVGFVPPGSVAFGAWAFTKGLSLEKTGLAGDMPVRFMK